MRVSDLTPNPKNPRTITDAKLAQLKKALHKFGDLSGIVFNRKTKQLVSGHQRVKLATVTPDIHIEKKFPKPTKTGTVAQGFIYIGGDRFSYREVDWDRATEKAAMIAANHNAGDDDLAGLSSLLKELQNIDFDLDLTMLSEIEMLELPNPIEVEAHTRERKPPKNKSPRCRDDQVYMLGQIRLRCGGDLLFCDDIISRWERHSGETARLIPPKAPQESVKQSQKQARTQPSHA